MTVGMKRFFTDDYIAACDKALAHTPCEASSDLSAERLKDDPRQNIYLSPSGGYEQGRLHGQEHC